MSHDYHHNSGLQFIITQAAWGWGAQFILVLTRYTAIEKVDHAC